MHLAKTLFMPVCRHQPHNRMLATPMEHAGFFYRYPGQDQFILNMIGWGSSSWFNTVQKSELRQKLRPNGTETETETLLEFRPSKGWEQEKPSCGGNLITDIFFYALSPYHSLFKAPPTPSYLVAHLRSLISRIGILGWCWLPKTWRRKVT